MGEQTNRKYGSVVGSAIETVLVRQSENGGHPKTLPPVFEPTEMSRPCPIPEQQFKVRGWRFGEKFTLAREAISHWGQRVHTRSDPTTLNDADPRHIRRTRAAVEAERCKAFWWE